ncbi:Transcriptional activator protein raiR [Candidatus Rhodobacter oscarellae]|uniref:Transcriptional activator protein raiR n=1 Tax=Candidatus Rhodobacter oscarellae TaxID=1675527 RepID=A0A0J9H132_9RHOB|nr:LuxR family transcriptional regulator [Candidatus Rhodobacter lobularis]KMW59448.1 Transcriptional activator protein raiR [Candidatus Rhodobacter lobularis]
MQGRLDTYIETVQSANSLDELQGRIKDLRNVFDVEHVVYHSINSLGQQYASHTYTPEWETYYFAENFERIDPVVQGCLRRFHPVDWRRLDWSGKAARDFLGEAVDAGVGHQGFSVPIRGPSGQFALFTISDRRSDAVWEKYTEAHVRDVILAAHFINQKALEIERGSDEADVAKLSPREVDALTMLAMGYNRAQASESLSISEHTLRVYIESARSKLGAANTTHAIAKALTLGLVIV